MRSYLSLFGRFEHLNYTGLEISKLEPELIQRKHELRHGFTTINYHKMTGSIHGIGIN